jgi:uncharacterized integral membrane protein
MRYDTATFEFVRVGAVIGLLLIGLLLVVIANRQSMISLDTYQVLLIAMVFAFPLVIIALMQAVSSDNFSNVRAAGPSCSNEEEW